jgi:hypothetical protein
VSAFTDGLLVGATITVALGVLAARAHQAWRERSARRITPVSENAAALAARFAWADGGQGPLPPLRYVPLRRTPEENQRHFQVVRDAEAVIDAGLDLLGPLYDTGARLHSPAE